MGRLQWSLNASTSALKEASTTSLHANASHAIWDADHALALQASNAHPATMATSSSLDPLSRTGECSSKAQALSEPLELFVTNL